MRVFPTLTQDGEWQALDSDGFEGSLNDKQYAYLGYLGLEGGLPDRMGAFLASPLTPIVFVSQTDSTATYDVVTHLIDSETYTSYTFNLLPSYVVSEANDTVTIEA